MMVMMTAMTPSLKASSRPVPISMVSTAARSCSLMTIIVLLESPALHHRGEFWRAEAAIGWAGAVRCGRAGYSTPLRRDRSECPRSALLALVLAREGNFL